MPLYPGVGVPAVTDVVSSVTANLITTGEETIDRRWLSQVGIVSTSGTLRLTYFTARKTETTTQVKIYTGTTAAAATPTLCRLGLYQIASDGAGTLVASTANDTTLFAAATTAYTKSWSVSFAKVAGQRYALGVLVVSGAATPTYLGSINSSAGVHATLPRLTASLGAQADLPGSFTDASLSGSAGYFYAEILP